MRFIICSSLFFFNDTATTEIYTLSLHDALPIWLPRFTGGAVGYLGYDVVRTIESLPDAPADDRDLPEDRKSTRLNSSHANISYAVFCLKKKKKKTQRNRINKA